MRIQLRNKKILNSTSSQDEEPKQFSKYAQINKQQIREMTLYKNRYLSKNKKIRKPKIDKNKLVLLEKNKTDVSSYQCAICMQILIQPTMLVCGHTFCLKCLQCSTAYTNCCALCRVHQKTLPFFKNKSVEQYIQKFIVPTLNQEEYIHHLCRTTDHNEWLNNKKPSELKQKQLIDFNDILHIWRRAEIVQHIELDQKCNQIKIRYKWDDDFVFQTIQVNSRRIANYLFFTGNKYLCQFTPSFDWNKLIIEQSQINISLQNGSISQTWPNQIIQSPSQILNNMPEEQSINSNSQNIFDLLGQQHQLLSQFIF